MTTHGIRTVLFAGLMLAFVGPAHAQKLDARYGIWFANIPIGKAQWTIEVHPDTYTMAASGNASGLISTLIDGESTITVRGAMREGKPSPAQFTMQLKRDDEKSETRMTLDGGDAKDIVATPPSTEKDRVPVTDAHRRGIVDPLSALVIPAGAEGLTAQTCQRALPIFDGRRRYNLQLSFKRMDKVKADKGYAGPALVCAATFQPVAGHRANSALAKYLTEGRDIEIWFVPVTGTAFLAPFRLQIASMIGNMVISASQFEASANVAKVP